MIIITNKKDINDPNADIVCYDDKQDEIKIFNAIDAFFYAIYIINGRWPEAEPIIMKNPAVTFRYACDVIKGRWLEAELIIAEDQHLWDKYCKHFELHNQ
jgi:hypothetical protein